MKKVKINDIEYSFQCEKPFIEVSDNGFYFRTEVQIFRNKHELTPHNFNSPYVLEKIGEFIDAAIQRFQAGDGGK